MALSNYFVFLGFISNLPIHLNTDRTNLNHIDVVFLSDCCAMQGNKFRILEAQISAEHISELVNHRIIKSFGLEKLYTIIKCNHHLTLAIMTMLANSGKVQIQSHNTYTPNK